MKTAAKNKSVSPTKEKPTPADMSDAPGTRNKEDTMSKDQTKSRLSTMGGAQLDRDQSSPSVIPPPALIKSPKVILGV